MCFGDREWGLVDRVIEKSFESYIITIIIFMLMSMTVTIDVTDILEREFDFWVVFDERVDGPAYSICRQTPDKLAINSVAADNSESPLLLSLNWYPCHSQYFILFDSTSYQPADILT